MSQSEPPLSFQHDAGEKVKRCSSFAMTVQIVVYKRHIEFKVTKTSNFHKIRSHSSLSFFYWKELRRIFVPSINNALWAGTWYLVCGPLCSVTGQQAFAALPPFCRRSTSKEFSLKSQFPWFLGALEVGPRNGIWLTKSELWIENIFIAETQKYYFLTNIICRYSM